MRSQSAGGNSCEFPCLAPVLLQQLQRQPSGRAVADHLVVNARDGAQLSGCARNESLVGRIETPTIGGSEQSMPAQEIVAIFGLPVFP